MAVRFPLLPATHTCLLVETVMSKVWKNLNFGRPPGYPRPMLLPVTQTCNHVPEYCDSIPSPVSSTLDRGLSRASDITSKYRDRTCEANCQELYCAFRLEVNRDGS